MAKHNKVDTAVKSEIVKLRNEKKTIEEISKQVKRSKSVVSRVLTLYNATGRLTNSKKPGRPRKTTVREDRVMQRLALKDRFLTASQISKDIADVTDVSRQTVSRRLHEIGLYARSPVKKPLISKKNQAARLAFANKHVIWSEKEWQKVFFSDESKFNVFGSDGKHYVRRRTGESLNHKCTKKTVKFGGGSVMVFGMISCQGTSPLVRLNCRVNSTVYKNVLKQHVVPVLQNSGIENPVFMQDNAPCHKAKLVMEYLADEGVDVMDWPAQSPDMNPIENLWMTLGQNVMARNPKNTEDLWEKLVDEWSKITVAQCQNLVKSCSRRCAAVIENKGRSTKY